MAAEGATVVVNDLGDEAEAVVAEIERAAGGTAVANHASVSDWGGHRGPVADTVDRFGDLHIVVNNAGILRDKMSFNMDESDWDPVVDVHLKGHFCVSAPRRRLLAQPRPGRVPRSVGASSTPPRRRACSAAPPGQYAGQGRDHRPDPRVRP